MREVASFREPESTVFATRSTPVLVANQLLSNVNRRLLLRLQSGKALIFETVNAHCFTCTHPLRLHVVKLEQSPAHIPCVFIV
jgi:hypothetical protein